MSEWHMGGEETTSGLSRNEITNPLFESHLIRGSRSGQKNLSNSHAHNHKTDPLLVMCSSLPYFLWAGERKEQNAWIFSKEKKGGEMVETS